MYEKKKKIFSIITTFCFRRNIRPILLSIILQHHDDFTLLLQLPIKEITNERQPRSGLLLSIDDEKRQRQYRPPKNAIKCRKNEARLIPPMKKITYEEYLRQLTPMNTAKDESNQTPMQSKTTATNYKSDRQRTRSSVAENNDKSDKTHQLSPINTTFEESEHSQSPMIESDKESLQTHHRSPMYGSFEESEHTQHESTRRSTAEEVHRILLESDQ